MDISIELTVETSFDGTVRYTLEGSTDQKGVTAYWIRRRGSTQGIYAAPNDPDSECCVRREAAERFIEDLASLSLGAAPPYIEGLDGTTTTVRITRGFNSAVFTWWEDLPDQWAGLRIVSEFFQRNCRDWSC